MRGRAGERERWRTPAAIFLPCHLKSPEEDRRWIWRILLPLSLAFFSWMLFSPLLFHSFPFIVASPVHSSSLLLVHFPHFTLPFFPILQHFLTLLLAFLSLSFHSFLPIILLFSLHFSVPFSFLTCLHLPLLSSPNPSPCSLKPKAPHNYPSLSPLPPRDTFLSVSFSWYQPLHPLLLITISLFLLLSVWLFIDGLYYCASPVDMVFSVCAWLFHYSSALHTRSISL